MHYLDPMEDTAAASVAPPDPARAPRVSIVVPTYNGLRHIGSTLDSIEAQTFTDWELIVFDDGSTDATLLTSCDAHRSAHRRCREASNGGVATGRGTKVSP